MREKIKINFFANFQKQPSKLFLIFMQKNKEKKLGLLHIFLKFSPI